MNMKHQVKVEFIDDYLVLDTTKMIVKYQVEVVPNIEKPDITDTDIVILQIGSQISKSYSYGLYKNDSLATTNKNLQAYKSFSSGVPTIEVFKNHPVGKSTIVHRIPNNLGGIFLYKDEIDINWQLIPDKKEIMGYKCQKAIATFRGRSWEAWFTNQIPVSDGPWKFDGLPGLILQLRDQENHFVVSIVGLETDIVPIKFYNWSYQETYRKKANNYIKWCQENFYDCIKNSGTRISLANGTLDQAKKMSISHNPLELE